jgi:hypothetical protein
MQQQVPRTSIDFRLAAIAKPPARCRRYGCRLARSWPDCDFERSADTHKAITMCRKNEIIGSKTETATAAELLPLEIWLSLFEEGAQAFGAVLGFEAADLLFDFVLECLGQRGAFIAK